MMSTFNEHHPGQHKQDTKTFPCISEMHTNRHTRLQLRGAGQWLKLKGVCCTGVHSREKLRGKLLRLWFPHWNVLECWMSGCLLWLIMLPFTRLSQCPITTQRRVRMVIQRAGWSATSKDYHWLFGSLLSLLIIVCQFLHIKSLRLLFLSSLSVSPADRHMFIQHPPAEIRHAECCVENPSKGLHSSPSGTRPL